MGVVERFLGNINDLAMDICEGDFRKVDYLLDCSYYEYYFRLLQYKKYGKRYASNLKKGNNKGGNREGGDNVRS